MTNRIYGWKKQATDNRDLTMRDLKAVRPMVTVLPVAANLRRWCSEIEDQGQLGSCTANAWVGALEYDLIRYGSGSKYTDFSRLFLYYNERVADGDVTQDGGSELRTGAKVLNQQGVCPESEWPYVVSQFTVKPTPKCYTDAVPNVIHSYYNLDGITGAKTLTNVKTAIASGQPVVFGFTVYDSFESDAVAATGVIPVPNTKTEQVLGGHAVCAVGYDDTQQRLLVRNSWGRSWGLPAPLYRGYFTMPYKVVADSTQASDFWTVVRNW